MKKLPLTGEWFSETTKPQISKLVQGDKLCFGILLDFWDLLLLYIYARNTCHHFLQSRSKSSSKPRSMSAATSDVRLQAVSCVSTSEHLELKSGLLQWYFSNKTILLLHEIVMNLLGRHRRASA